MDLSMPILDGFKATEKIRQYQRKKKQHQPMIIACTGHTEEEYIRKAWRYQFDEVIPKPANIDVIKILFSEVLQLKQD